MPSRSDRATRRNSDSIGLVRAIGVYCKHKQGCAKGAVYEVGFHQAQFANFICRNTTSGCICMGKTRTTSLRGTVLDKTGAAIVGATVTLDNAAQAVHHQVKTGPSGEYEFLALLPGTYSLTVEAAGFRKSEQKNMQLLVNTPATLNVTLEVGTTTETVEVSAQATTLNTTDASLGNAFSERRSSNCRWMRVTCRICCRYKRESRTQATARTST